MSKGSKSCNEIEEKKDSDLDESSSKIESQYEQVSKEVSFELNNLNDFKKIGNLGSGSFGICVGILHIPSKTQFAAKFFKKERYDLAPNLFQDVRDFNNILAFLS